MYLDIETRKLRTAQTNLVKELSVIDFYGFSHDRSFILFVECSLHDLDNMVMNKYNT